MPSYSQLLSLAAVLSALPAALAEDYYITVGKPDPTTLKPKNSFEPNYVNAKVGDKVKFQL